MSSISESSFQDFGQPIAVGMVTTEGEKLLNALRKIQFKLKDNPRRHETNYDKSEFSVHRSHKSRDREDHNCCSSGDHYLRTDKSHKYLTVCSHKPIEDKRNQLIEIRLKLIETQLQNISLQLKANNLPKSETNGKHMFKTIPQKEEQKPIETKTKISNIEDEIQSDDKYEASINAIKQLIRLQENQNIKKSVSLDAINHKNIPSKHFHLQYKDIPLRNIPFILGTNSSRSHSVIANQQMEISRLKQHNPLCSDRFTNRHLINKTIKTQELDNEIKDLLYDLKEDHDYICEEIQYLSKQLETITDPKRRNDFKRELYFLSRRILAKRRQINELQELHSIVRTNSLKQSNQRVDTNPKTFTQNRPNIRHKYQTTDTLSNKWI